MATPDLQQDDLRTLDQTRQRLSQLANNIASLKSDIQQGNPLPPWFVAFQPIPTRLLPLQLQYVNNFNHRESIQTSASILGTNINSIVDHLSRNGDMFNRTVVYPSTNYPGRTQEGLLGQLLRKKLEPQVETSVEEGRAIEEGARGGGEEEDVEQLWAWGKEWFGQRVATYIMEEAGDNYTVEEREMGIENVNVGLRRMFDEESDEDEEEDGDGDGDRDMQDVGLEVTTVGKSGGQVQYGLEEVRRSPDGRSRAADEIMRFATSRTEHPLR